MPDIRIVTDSTCDLPAEIVEEFGITVVPNYVNIGEASYQDGTELPREEFYNKIFSYTSFPRTSGPGTETYHLVYERLAQQGATAILSIHVAGAFSSIYSSACVAARAFSSLPVTVIDSQSVTLGLGFQVLEAARAAASGLAVDEIVARVKDKARRTFIYASLDTVEYLRRSGRASQIQAGLAAFLQIFPVLKVFMSEVSLERIRTRTRSVERLAQHLEEMLPLENVAILHTNALEKVETLRRMISRSLPSGLPVWIGMATPAIGAHVGPNAVGLVFVRDGFHSGSIRTGSGLPGK